MDVKFTSQEHELLQLLKRALNNEIGEIEERANSDLVVSLAKKHTVLSLLYNVTKEEAIFTKQQETIESATKQVILQSYRLLFITKYVVNILKEHGVKTVVLKGVATASFYPVPEFRKSGDVDLLISAKEDISSIKQIMFEAGFELAEEQHANHHTVFVSREGIHVEIHGMLSEPFAYKRINNAMQKQTEECWKYVHDTDVMGVILPILDKPYHAYELLLHMLQHFVFAGFGLKLLCDWVMIWRGDWSAEEKDLFSRLVDESGLMKFAEAITSVSSKYLGMNLNKFAWEINEDNIADEVLRDILDAEEFGNADANRMVLMSGTGIGSYIKEFHHQMHLNFPKAGKCPLLWPILWFYTLFKFLYNNHVVRNVSTRKILKEAKRRSRLTEEMKLFER